MVKPPGAPHDAADPPAWNSAHRSGAEVVFTRVDGSRVRSITTGPALNVAGMDMVPLAIDGGLFPLNRIRAATPADRDLPLLDRRFEKT